MRRKCAAALVAASAMLLSSGARSASALVGSTSNLNINTFLGADRFYNAGYTGSRTIVANIEAGWVWNGQESLTQVATLFQSDFNTGEFDRHATWVGSTIAGRPTAGGGEYQRGIAYGATLWSGSISTGWAPPSPPATYSLGFGFSGGSMAQPYIIAMQTGIGGQTADVINSSWSTGGSPGGNSYSAETLDSMAFATGKTIVVAAGNNGPGPDTVFAPASGLNSIAVAALTSDVTDPPYNSAASFSSRSPNEFFLPTSPSGITGTVIDNARAAIDIAAPGVDLTLAEYDGPTGGNGFGGPSSLANNLYKGGLNGTSFASPVVAGGAALVVDAGKALFPADPSAIDGRVVKAVLMNSADKTANWNNGQTLANGVLTTTQALDYVTGAGRMNLSRAFDQYTAGTTDLPGVVGGAVQDIGWDFGRVATGAPQDYLLNGTLAAGSMLTATLDWFADGQTSNYGSFDNLDLQVWSADPNGAPLAMIAQSATLYNTSEHLSFALPGDGQYLLRVEWENNLYNFAGDRPRDNYGLAWNVTAVPEPVSAMGLFAGVFILMRKPSRRGRASDPEITPA